MKIDGSLSDQANLNEFINFSYPVTTFLAILGGVPVN